MEEPADSGRHVGFLPPEPAGPEPDLTGPPGASQPRVPALDHGAFAPPAGTGREQPPATYPPAEQQLGWSPPPPPSGGQPNPPQPWSYPTGVAVPDNGAAVAGLTLSITAGALLLLSVTTSTIISIACAALGIYYSRKGRDRVDRGETPKHRGVAQAGFVTGIVTLGLSIFFTLLWVLFAVLYATNEDFREDLKDQLEDRGGSLEGLETSLRVGAVAVRLLASLLR